MAILKSQAAKLKVAVAAPVVSKEENVKAVAKQLEVAVGRPPEGAKENRTRAATAAVMAGAMTFADAERLYAVSQTEVRRFIERVFPTDDDKYAFLENCMISNAMLASSRFTQCFGELNAVDAARAAAIFAGKATDIRKAREAGFKEAPINVTTILALESTLRKLTQPTTVEMAT